MPRNTGRRLVKLLFLTVFGLVSPLAWSQSDELPQAELITDRQGLPQGFVAGLMQDQQEFIWIATNNGLCRYDGNRFKVFPFRPGEKSSLSFSDLRSLQQDPEEYVWITSDQTRINRFDPRTETFTDFSRQVFGQLFHEKVRLGHCYPDRQNRLWLALEGRGLICFDKRTGNRQWFRHRADQPNSLASDEVRQILQDKSGTIWVATDAGLDQFHEQTGQFSHHRPGSQTPLNLPEKDLYSLYLGPSGEILVGSARYITRFTSHNNQIRSYRLPADGEKRWGFHFATDSRGIIYFDQRDRLFRFTDQQGPQLLTRLTPQTGLCASLLIDRSDVLWVGTDGSGIRKYDLRTNGFQAVLYQVNFQTDLLTKWLGVPASLIGSDVKVLDPYLFRYAQDKQGWFWFNCGSSAFLHVNPQTHEVRKTTFPVSFFNKISPMATDEQGKTWIFRDQQLWWYDPGRQQWIRSDYRLEWKKTFDIIQMVVDEQAFWFASQARGLFRLDRQTGKVRQYSHQPGQPTSLSNDALFCLSADPADPNRLWIGTFGSGLCGFDKRSGQSRRLTDQQGLPDNVIYSALPDQAGYLWIGTNKGLCRMNRKTFQMRVYTTEDGLLANEFNRFHYLPLPNGPIIMGGVAGLTVFQPSQLKDDRFEPKIELTALQVNNRFVEPGLNSPLPNPIHVINELTLPHDQNFLTVQFAAMQYNRPGKNRYRYKLEGIDADWVESPQSQAIYTALPAGHYTLLVNASNTSGYWSPYVRKLAITIMPPWWRTWWAYLLYGSIAIALAGYGLRLFYQYHPRFPHPFDPDFVSTGWIDSGSGRNRLPQTT
jgi:ligand-binding sensor domain-containing protein